MPQKKLAHSIYETDHASPGLLFWRAFFNWQRLIRAALEPHNLTQGQYAVLAALYFIGSDESVVTQQNIADQLAMDKMMVSDVVKSLLKKGLLNRKSHPEDARAKALSITPQGKAVLRKSVPIVEAVDEKFFQSIEGDYPEFLKGLRTLARLEAMD